MRIEKKYRVPKIVAPTERGPSWLRTLLLLLVVMAVGWYGYQLGSSGVEGGFDAFRPSQEERIKSLKKEREELRRQLTMQQQVSQMDQEAMRVIKEQVKKFQDERLKMEEELAFLRGIVSTGPDKKGLRIQNFKLQPGLEEQQYTYRFSVSQVINSGQVAKGRIHLTLEGLQDGQSRTLELKELAEDKLDSHKMRFRYFQNIEGKLKLPEGFMPATLNIEVKPTNKKLEPVSESFDWEPVS